MIAVTNDIFSGTQAPVIIGIIIAVCLIIGGILLRRRKQYKHSQGETTAKITSIDSKIGCPLTADTRFLMQQPMNYNACSNVWSDPINIGVSLPVLPAQLL